MKSRQLEKTLQTKVLKQLRLLPCSHWIKLNDRATIGLPDIIGCVGGQYVAIELKTQTKLTKLQAHTLKKMQGAGAVTYVVYPKTWPDVLKELTVFAEMGLKSQLFEASPLGF